MPERLIKDNALYRSILDAVPSPILIVDDDVKIVDFNLAAALLVSEKPEAVIKSCAGDVLNCIHSIESEAGCGKSSSCEHCIIRNSVNKAIAGQSSFREKTKMTLSDKTGTKDIYLSVTTSPFEYLDEKLFLLILEDISELIGLKGIIPICSNCKNVRSDKGFWERVEKYVQRHSEAEFSHGICPECSEKLYGDQDWFVQMQKENKKE